MNLSSYSETLPGLRSVGRASVSGHSGSVRSNGHVAVSIHPATARILLHARLLNLEPGPCKSSLSEHRNRETGFVQFPSLKVADPIQDSRNHLPRLFRF